MCDEIATLLAPPARKVDPVRRRQNTRAWIRLIVHNVLFGIISMPVYIPQMGAIIPPYFVLICGGVFVWIWHPLGVSLSLAHFSREMVLEAGKWPLAGLLFSASSIGTWAYLSFILPA